MAGSLIGALRVSLGLDTADFEDGLNRAQSKLSGFGGHVKASGIGAALDEVFDRSRLKLLDTGIERVGLFGSAFEKLGAIGIAAGVGIGAAAFAFESLSKSLEMADKLGKLAQQVGVPVEELSKLKYAAELSDVSLEQLSTGLERLSKNMATVSEGAKGPAAAAFQALGVQVKAADGTLRPASDVLLQVAGRFAGMRDGATKTALAIGIFGKSGADLIPLLNQGSAGIRKLSDEAAALGLVVTEKTAAGAEEFNDSLKTLHGALDGVGLQLAADLAPALNAFAQGLVDAATHGTVLHDVITILSDVLKVLLASIVAVGGAFAEMWEWGKGALEVAGDITRLDFKSALHDSAQAGQAMISTAVGTVKEIGQIGFGSTPAAEGASRTGAPPALVDPNAAKKAAAEKTASDQAIAQAAKAELAARIALTGDIVELARLKALQVDQETKDANQHLADEAAQGKITAAAAAQATALNDRTATEKKILILRERDAQLAQRAVDQEAELEGYRAQAAQAQAQLTGDTVKRARIEETALAAQQKLDRDRLAAENATALAAGKRTQAEADALTSAQAEAQAAARELKHRQDIEAIENQALAIAQARRQTQIDLLHSEAAAARATSTAAQFELEALKIKQAQEIADQEQLVASLKLNQASAEEIALAEARLETLKKIHANELKVAEREAGLDKQVQEAVDTISSLRDAVSKHDWLTAFDDLAKTIEMVQTALAKMGATGSLGQLAVPAAVVGNLIGGKVGDAVNNGLGIGLGISKLASLVPALGFLGPLAPIAGLIAGLATLFGNSKPSNFTAIAEFQGLNGVTFTGDKPNADTQKLIQQAGGGILDAEKALTAFGITLNKTVAAIEIGSRDPSTIHLSDGTILHSAVGDPSAAADTALKAVLQGATYASAAEKQLVDSMIAAGKGFDAITSALQGYEQAQAVGQQLADQILQLTDPKQYDLNQVTEGIKAQRDAAKALFDQAYLTADQLAAINGQLDTLQGLELGKVLAKYTTATDDAAAAAAQLASAQQQAGDLVASARDALQQAYDAQAADIKSTIQAYQQLRTSLTSFGQTLAAQAKVDAGPQAALTAAQAAFRSLAGKTDATSLGELQAAAQAYLDAGKAGATSAAQFAQIQGEVRAAIAQGAAAAGLQVDYAQAQLAALDAQVAGLLTLNTSVLSVVAAIQGLQSALTAQAALNSPAAGAAPANDNIDVAKYLADNPSLVDNWNQGGIMRQLGANLAQAAFTQYELAGKAEIAAGTRKFATGGGFQVGGMGPTDSKLVSLMASPGEYVSVSHGDAMSGMLSEMRALRADWRAGMAQLALNTGKSAKLHERWDGDGLPATRSVA